MSNELLSSLFLLLTLTMALTVFALLFRNLAGRARIISLIGVAAWLLYVGVLGYTGLAALKMPPGLALVAGPAFLSTFLLLHPGAKAFALRVRPETLISLQAFRLLVELGLFELYHQHRVPQLMTFEGGNLDIVIALSAPLIVYLYATRRINATAARAWNILGILMLANIVGRSILVSVGVLKTDILTLGIVQFPFVFLPGFLAPLALYLHVLTLRALAKPSAARPEAADVALEGLRLTPGQ